MNLGIIVAIGGGLMLAYLLAGWGAKIDLKISPKEAIFWPRPLWRRVKIEKRALTILREAKGWLDKAIACYDDEKWRQNYMNQVARNFRLLVMYQLGPSFQDAVTLLLGVARQATPCSLNKEQLLLVKEALLDFRKLNFGYEVVCKHRNVLVKAGINVDLS